MNRMEGRERLKETSDQFSEQLSEGERIQEDGEESDRILQGMELDGLDSDTQQKKSMDKKGYWIDVGEAFWRDARLGE